MGAADFDQIVTLGLAAMFGSLPLVAPIGWLVGRWAGFEAGASLVLLVFGAVGAAAATWLAVHVHVQTAVVTAPRGACEAAADGAASERYAVNVDGWAGTAVVSGGTAACERAPDEPLQRLRVRRPLVGALETTGRHEDDPRQANALIGVFGAFGGFGLLAGLFFAATSARRHRAEAPVDVRALSPRRHRLTLGFTIAGNLSMVGCALTAAFADLDAVRSGTLVFGGAAAGCVSFALAMMAKRTLALDTALILAIVGGGCALAALSLWYLG